MQMNPESRTMLPKMAFSGFASRYREPTLDEGFQDITKVDFKVCFSVAVDAPRMLRGRLTYFPQFVGTEAQKALWRKYWVS